MNRALFIIPYFGKFNNYFQLFLNSCGVNTKFDWLIITDDFNHYRYPANVKVCYSDFDTLRGRIRGMFDHKIKLNAPYKLCEYRLAYGEIFCEEIKGYEFWGFCDVDMIFGNIEKYIDDDILNSYDKILFRGHMQLLRNNEVCRTLYKVHKKGMPIDYQYAFSTNYSCHFDEHEMWRGVVGNLGIREYRKVIYADIACEKYPFKIVDGKETYARQIFEYDNGMLLRHFLDGAGSINTDEWCYIHLQKRKMIIELNDVCDKYYIVPNRFIDTLDNVDERLIMRWSKDGLYLYRKYARLKEIFRNIKQGAIQCRIHSIKIR